jgi:hypothetical protein
MEPASANPVSTPVAELDRTPTAVEDNAAKTAREDFYVCPVCGERVDWRDPDAVLAHADHAPELVEASKRFNASPPD